MIRINIGRRKYRIPTHWEDITLSQCVWLHERAQGLSAELRSYYLSFASAEGAKVPEDKTEIAVFTTDTLTHLAGLSPQVVSRITAEDLLTISTAVLPRFVCGVLGRVDYAPSGRRSFCLGLRYYRYPATRADVMGVPTPLSTLSAVELCQVSDIVTSGRIALAPLALAVCCRPWGERYSEVRAQRRAAQFARLSSSMYWELWARVSAAHDYLRSSFPECYGRAGSGAKASEKTVLWSDMMVSLSVGNPAALTALQRMNGYDFVHLMNESIKQKSEEWKMNAALSGLKLR